MTGTYKFRANLLLVQTHGILTVEIEMVIFTTRYHPPESTVSPSETRLTTPTSPGSSCVIEGTSPLLLCPHYLYQLPQMQGTRCDAIRYENFDLLISASSVVFDLNIDIRDYVNGIGNRSHEPHIRAGTPCYSLHPVANQKLTTKWPKIGTAAPLSINNSKTEQVPSLSQAYSSEGVISLNEDNEDGASKPLCYSLRSHKVQEAKCLKMADFSPFL